MILHRWNKLVKKHFHKQFNLNVLGLLLTTKEALALIRQRAAASLTSVRQ